MEKTVFPAAMDVSTARLAPEDEPGLAFRVATVHVTLCLPVTRLDDLTPTRCQNNGFCLLQPLFCVSCHQTGLQSSLGQRPVPV